MSRIFGLAVVLFGFFIASSTFGADPASGAPLKVLTLNFNSEEVFNDGSFRVRDLRFSAIKKWIEENSPDVVFLEEAWSYRHDHSVALSLARAIDYDVSYRLEMGFLNLFTEADAVLAKKSLRMIERDAFKLPHSAASIGDGKTWEIELGAVSYATGAELMLPNGEPLYAFATHLDSSTASNRGDQARALIVNAKAHAERDGVSWERANVIIAGDFNSRVGDPAFLAMTQEGFVDTYGAAHPDDHTSCTLCELPTNPWFNPFTISAGFFPSQNGESDVARIDYVFSHGPSLKPVASTITFTAPLDGIWLSDHYGVVTTFAEPGEASVANPTHDSPGDLPPAVVRTLVPGMFFKCAVGDCADQLKAVTVDGSKGFVLENRSGSPVRVVVSGPGYVYGSNAANLNDGEQSSFTFGAPGDYAYTVENGPASREPNAMIRASIHVRSTGY